MAAGAPPKVASASDGPVLPHLLPYLLYVAPPALAEWAGVPASATPWTDPVRVLAAAAAYAAFARRGAYPELGRGAARPRAAVVAVLAGVAVALLWMPLAEVVPRLGARDGFHPAAAGAGMAPFLWSARIAGFVLVAPAVEELFVRSLLPRWVDAAEAWRDRPVGRFTPASAAVSVAFFSATHPEWLAALVAGALWTLLLGSTGRLRDAVLAHAVANGLLAAWWLGARDWTWW